MTQPPQQHLRKDSVLLRLRHQRQWWSRSMMMKQQQNLTKQQDRYPWPRFLVPTLLVSLVFLLALTSCSRPLAVVVVMVNAYQSPPRSDHLNNRYCTVNRRLPSFAKHHQFWYPHSHQRNQYHRPLLSSSSSLSTQLYMHMGHSHSHHDHLHTTTGTTASITSPLPSSAAPQLFPFSNVIRTRRFIAMIIFCTVVAIIGPSVFVMMNHRTAKSTTLSTRLLTFGLTSSVILVAEPIRNSILRTIERIRSIGEGISKHSTPITASYLFQNTNDADRITLLGGVMNVILSVSKFVVGVTCHSSVLIADAGHSLSDLFSDFVTLWAVQVARLPPDQDHPYGHGKFEAVGSLFLSLTLIGTGIGVGAMANNNLIDILSRQRRGAILSHQIPSLPALAMALLSVVSKEWLFRVTRVVGQRLQSQVVIANAWHHRSDAYSSILAFFSIGVAMSIPGLVFVDAAAGLFVAAMIGMTGMEILGESVKQLTDTSNEELVQKVTQVANENVDVEQVVRVRARHVGSASSVDVSVTMPEDRTASAARAVEERLKQQILQHVGDGVVDVDVRATAPPRLTVNGDADDDDTMVCTALESRATFNNPVSVEEIESCVRDEILRRHSDTVASVPVITVYYRDSILIDVDVHIRLVTGNGNDNNPGTATVREATNIGKEVRITLESSKQISKARIYLDLDN